MGYSGKFKGYEIDAAITSMGVAQPFEERSAEQTAYKLHDYATKDGKLVTCKVNEFRGPWNAASWEETTCLAELRKIWGNYNGVEQLTIQFAVNKGSGVVAGKTVTIQFSVGSQTATRTETIDANGQVKLNIPYGDVFRIVPSAMEGYIALTSIWYTAMLPTRVLNYKFTEWDNGMYIVKQDKTLVPVADWNTDNNADAWGYLYTDAALGNDNAIVLPKTQTISSAKFQVEYVDCSTVANKGNATQANAEVIGKELCEKWKTWTETDDGSGETPRAKYNRTQGKSIGVQDYLPAIYAAYNRTSTIGGATLHGYVPAMGQLRKMCDNLTLFQQTALLIGGSFPNIDSGNWWSSSECNGNHCWILNGGASNSYSKAISLQVLACYDLSEVNL